MRVIVVGGGIVGLATARALARRGDEVTVLEKETALARHQTGRNSGVIHSGIYYPPGSLKATMAVRGAASMTAFARERGIPVETTGKLVVATSAEEVPALHKLADRATANGVPARLVTKDEARGYEPYVSCVEALRVETTGIIDYGAVCVAYAEDIQAGGGLVCLGTGFAGVDTHAGGEDTTARAATGDDPRAVPADRHGAHRADSL